MRFVAAHADPGAPRLLPVRYGGPDPPLPYLDGRMFRRRPARPGLPVAMDDVSECLGDAAALSPDGRLVVTHVVGRRDNGADAPSDHGRIEAVNPLTGRAAVLADPACEPAVSSTGRLAYLSGEHTFTSPDANYHGRIVVRATPDGPPTAWTGVASWCYPRWAGSRLLVKTCPEDGYSGELFALDGPGRRRSIGGPPDGADVPSALVVAVSPDGERAAISGERRVRRAIHPMIEIVRLSDGRVLAALDTDGALDEGLAVDGQWSGSDIVAASDYCCGGSSHPPPGIAVLRYRSGRLTLRWSVGVGYERIGEQGQSQPGASQPRFLGRHRIGFWLTGYRTRWLTCNLVRASCRAARAVAAPDDDKLDEVARIVVAPGPGG